MSFSGVIISVFWLIHSIFLTAEDFTKNKYVGLLLVCSALFVAFLYFFIQYNQKRKTFTKKQLVKAMGTIEKLEKEVLTKQEQERAKERQRISEELHDGVLGKLFGTRIGLGFLEVSKEQDKRKYEDFLNKLQEIEKEIRTVSHKLSSNLNGTDINFYTLVDDLLKEKSDIGNFTYQLISDSIEWDTINEVVQLNLYRILQETIQNIIKHAKAKHVIISLHQTDELILLTIEDNGIGFKKDSQKKGIGLKNIQSRIKKLKGTYTIHSELGKGALLSIKVPYHSKFTIAG